MSTELHKILEEALRAAHKKKRIIDMEIRSSMEGFKYKAISLVKVGEVNDEVEEVVTEIHYGESYVIGGEDMSFTVAHEDGPLMDEAYEKINLKEVNSDLEKELKLSIQEEVVRITERELLNED